jgi:hypothetical protein
LSRTDNTDPHWVRAIWWEPEHWRCPRSFFYRGRPCDLPAEPIVSHRYSRWHSGSCSWVPTWDGLTAGGGHSAPPWYCRSQYTVPGRQRVRLQLAEARALHRAGDDLDEVDPDTFRHRHAAAYDWD